MSRRSTVSPAASSAPEPSVDRKSSALSAVAAAAAQDECDAFKDSVDLALAGGASEAEIVGAYAEGGLHRLDQGLSAVSFGWSGEPF